MAGRRTNLALLILVPIAALTGGAAFATGAAPAATLVTALHGAVGLGVVLLVPWKQAISRSGLRRRPLGGTVILSLLLVAVVGVALLTGLLHATGLVVDPGWATSMQLHVGAGLAAVPLVVVHARRRPVQLRRTDVSRRDALRVGSLAAAAGAAWVVQEQVLRIAGAPGGDRRFTGSYEAGSLRPDEMPVTQWLDDAVPRIDAGEWRLRVGTRTLTYDELVALPADDVDAVIDCTGGWWARQHWQGVRLSTLVTGDASSVLVRSSTGFQRRLPGRELDRLLLATHVGGQPLSAGHGFPARLVVPGRRGFWWVKWVDRIEPSNVPWWVQSPFPLT